MVWLSDVPAVVNPTEKVFEIARLCWHYCWSVPFNIQFFWFPFTFGHVIWGSILIDVVIAVIYKMLQKGEYHSYKHGFWSPTDRGMVTVDKNGKKVDPKWPKT